MGSGPVPGREERDEEGINQEIAFVRRRHDSTIKKEAASGAVSLWVALDGGDATDRDTRRQDNREVNDGIIVVTTQTEFCGAEKRRR